MNCKPGCSSGNDPTSSRLGPAQWRGRDVLQPGTPAVPPQSPASLHARPRRFPFRQPRPSPTFPAFRSSARRARKISWKFCNRSLQILYSSMGACAKCRPGLGDDDGSSSKRREPGRLLQCHRRCRRMRLDICRRCPGPAASGQNRGAPPGHRLPAFISFTRQSALERQNRLHLRVQTCIQQGLAGEETPMRKNVGMRHIGLDTPLDAGGGDRWLGRWVGSRCLGELSKQPSLGVWLREKTLTGEAASCSGRALVWRPPPQPAGGSLGIRDIHSQIPAVPSPLRSAHGPARLARA
jgi:hypothetical protein